MVSGRQSSAIVACQVCDKERSFDCMPRKYQPGPPALAWSVVLLMFTESPSLARMQFCSPIYFRLAYEDDLSVPCPEISYLREYFS